MEASEDDAAARSVETKFCEEMSRRIAADFELVLLGGWPRGYEPGKGMPVGLTIDDLVPRRCDSIIGQITS